MIMSNILKKSLQTVVVEDRSCDINIMVFVHLCMIYVVEI
jgi:hypothetical protein